MVVLLKSWQKMICQKNQLWAPEETWKKTTACKSANDLSEGLHAVDLDLIDY